MACATSSIREAEERSAMAAFSPTLDPLLAIKGLNTRFKTPRGSVRAVTDVDLTLGSGEILGLVGESGSGKSALALSILRLIEPPGEIAGGEILFEGRNVLEMASRELRELRGRGIGIIFQQPQSCLNPVRRVGWHVADLLMRQGKLGRRSAWDAAIELLRAVGLPGAEKAMAYPHQLSGGQAQRVMIAIALALRPRLLIADEPTTALDVTVQAQILELLRERCRESGTSMILVSHDLGIVAQLADRVAVMYAGRIVEEGPVQAILRAPVHPYTLGLLRAAPRLGAPRAARLQDIPGGTPDLTRSIPGCAFAPRCRTREERNLTHCLGERPPAVALGRAHRAYCWAAAQAMAAPVEVASVAGENR
jgi:oligopeptide/dipeptide ABC transporter ATP-binding protein